MVEAPLLLESADFRMLFANRGWQLTELKRFYVAMAEGRATVVCGLLGKRVLSVRRRFFRHLDRSRISQLDRRRWDLIIITSKQANSSSLKYQGPSVRSLPQDFSERNFR